MDPPRDPPGDPPRDPPGYTTWDLPRDGIDGMWEYVSHSVVQIPIFLPIPVSV